MIKLYSDFNDSIYLEKEYITSYISQYINESSFSKKLLDVKINDLNSDEKNNINIIIKLSDKINCTYDKLEHLYFEIKYLLKSIFLIEQAKINIIIG